MTDEEIRRDLTDILSRLLTQIIKYGHGRNPLLPTAALVLKHIEYIALSALQDYPCDAQTSVRVARPWYTLKSIYAAARGWRQGDYKADVESVVVVIRCTIQEALDQGLQAQPRQSKLKVLPRAHQGEHL